MLILWALSILCAFGLGYFFRYLTTKIKVLEEQVREKIDKPKEEATSTLVDPLDPVQEALYRQKKIMQGLNPDE